MSEIYIYALQTEWDTLYIFCFSHVTFYTYNIILIIYAWLSRIVTHKYDLKDEFTKMCNYRNRSQVSNFKVYPKPQHIGNWIGFVSTVFNPNIAWNFNTFM